MLNRLVFGFVAGAIAFLTFFLGAWALLQMAGYIPANAPPPWAMIGVPPWNVPKVVSYAFWSGLWGALLNVLLGRMTGALYWLAWIVVGAIALSLVALFVVPPLKGLPATALTPQRLFNVGLLHGMWGLGTAILLSLAGGGRDRYEP